MNIEYRENFRNHRALYTVEQAAYMASLGRTRMYDLIASGAIESVKIGRARRIPAAALDDYISRLVEEQNSGGAA